MCVLVSWQLFRELEPTPHSGRRLFKGKKISQNVAANLHDKINKEILFLVNHASFSRKATDDKHRVVVFYIFFFT